MHGNPDARCRDVDADLFFPDQYTAAAVDAARAVCGRCAIRDMCLTWALNHERHGIWAGLSPAERERLNIEEQAA